MYERRLRELGLFSLEKTKGDLTAVFNHLMRVYRKKGTRLFLEGSNERTRDNRYKLQWGKF